MTFNEWFDENINVLGEHNRALYLKCWITAANERKNLDMAAVIEPLDESSGTDFELILRRTWDRIRQI